MFSYLKAKIDNRLDGHMMEVVSGAGVAFFLKIVGAATQFVFSVVLARTLGAESAGVYFLVLTVCTVAWTLGCFGLQGSLLRFVAAHASKHEWVAVNGVYRKSVAIGTMASVALSVLLFMLAPYMAEVLFGKSDLMIPLRYMTLAIWPMSMILLHCEAIKGLKRIRDSQLVNGVLVPVVALAGLGVVGNRFGVSGAVLSYLLATLFAASVGYWFWCRATPQLRSIQASFSRKHLLNSCLPLLFVSSSYMVMQWSSTFALGIWGTQVDVGVFSLALRTASLTGFILISVNSIVAPKFSELYCCGDMQALARTARKSALLMTLLASPILLVFLIAPSLVMGIFGEEFYDGSVLLQIIALGQFVSVSTGSVGYLLMMTGRERLLRNNAVFGAFVAILLNLTLVPVWGALGAALATAISTSVVNMISFYLVWRKLGIWTLPVGRRWNSNNR